MKTRTRSADGFTAKILFAILLFAVTLAPVARAAANTVISTADSGAGTIRDTIAGSISGDAINFSPSLAGSTILLTRGQIVLSGILTMDAFSLPGGAQINGNHNSRIFYINSVSIVVLNALTLTDGALTSGIQIAGGVIY